MSDYDVLDDYLEHKGCVYIPYPILGWGWSRIFYNPEDRTFFYDQYSTGVIDDGEIRYHGTCNASLEQIISTFNKDWPPNDRGKKVLNEILEKDFPGTPLIDIPEKEPEEKKPEPENIHQEIWGVKG